MQPKRRIVLLAPVPVLDLVRRAEGAVEQLAGLERCEVVSAQRPAGAVALAFEGAEILLSGLVDAVDAGSERARLDRLIAELQRAIGAFRSKLDNAGYMAKAPPSVVEETRSRLQRAEADLAAAQAARQQA